MDIPLEGSRSPSGWRRHRKSVRQVACTLDRHRPRSFEVLTSNWVQVSDSHRLLFLRQVMETSLLGGVHQSWHWHHKCKSLDSVHIFDRSDESKLSSEMLSQRAVCGVSCLVTTNSPFAAWKTAVDRSQALHPHSLARLARLIIYNFRAGRAATRGAPLESSTSILGRKNELFNAQVALSAAKHGWLLSRTANNKSCFSRESLMADCPGPLVMLVGAN